tara:strand:+ start:1802 stop:3214 length:1413 start_codon:yes stop_codon:yes gene_type:complete
MNNRVWVVDDDRSIRWVLERAITRANIPMAAFPSADHALHHLPSEKPLAVMTDIRMPGTDGLQFITTVHEKYPEVPVIIMTAHSDLDSAVSAYSSGAFEYLPKPFDVDEALLILERAIAFGEESPIKSASKGGSEPEIIGQAPAMQEVFRAIGRLSHSNVTVLIRGSSGSGKELVAQAIHKHSPRSNQAFVALNMAAIPRDLIESELFGHEKGAFTGASSRREGRFSQANGGTLFLDEIGDMPMESQTRLLRVISNGEFYRVGGQTSIKTNVRIIAATHQDLEQQVRLGNFREDLFHRLNVICIHVPDLKDRKSDIELLADHFLKIAADELSEEPKILRPEALQHLEDLPWPGNVRQLANTCRWLTVMASGREIHLSDLPRELQTTSGSNRVTQESWELALSEWAQEQLALQTDVPLLNRAMPTFERIMIQAALQQTNGHKRDAAALLGWGRNTLTRKIGDLDLTNPGKY